MRKLIFIITGMLIHFYSISQIDTTFKLIPNWEKGEIRKYEIKNYSSLDTKTGGKINELTTKSIIIKVIDVNDNSYELNWKVDQLIFSDTIDSDNPFSGLINTLDKDLSIKYTLDQNGNIINVLNIDEISQTIKSRADIVLKEFIKKNGIEKSNAEMMNLQFSMMFSTDEQIKAIVLSDIIKFHQIYGYLFTTHKTTIIPDNIFAPNENGQPSDYLELKYFNFDDKNKTHFIGGELKCDTTNLRLRELIENNRIIKNTYEFKAPENWLISHKSIMNVDNGYVDHINIYEINWIE